MRPMLLAGLLTGILSLDAQGMLLLEENFDYGTAALESGYGPWQDGTGRVQYQTNNLAFTHASYANGSNTNGTGGLAIVAGTGDPRGAQRTFTTTPLSGEFWFSSVLRMESTAAVTNRSLIIAFNSATYSLSNPNGDYFGLGYSDVSGDTRLVPYFRDRSVSTNFLGATSFSSVTNYLLVAKVTINSGGADDLKLWLLRAEDTFGATEISLGTPDFIINYADWGNSVTNIWLGRDMNAAGRFDALRISTLSGDSGLVEVLGIPEPAALMLVLVGLAGAALVTRRRK